MSVVERARKATSHPDVVLALAAAALMRISGDLVRGNALQTSPMFMEIASPHYRALSLAELAVKQPIQIVNEALFGSTYPSGCHIAEVEIDPDTGAVQVVKYSSVNDFGTVINPLIVEGQLHGGIVQGIGQALYERTVFDRDGQFLTGSYMDYALPRAGDTCDIGFVSHPVPAKTNALGAKGCGEAGSIGAPAAVVCAVLDALRPLGVCDIEMPLTPARVWAAIDGARGRGVAGG